MRKLMAVAVGLVVLVTPVSLGAWAMEVHKVLTRRAVEGLPPALTLAPVSIAPIPNMREFIFQTVIDSQALVAGVLDADRRAAGGRLVYDDAYFGTFFTGARAVLEQRMSQASSAVASAIVSSWEQGGKPALPAGGTRAAGRRR